MLFRKDFAFLQVIVAVIAFVIPILLVLILPAGSSYSRGTVMIFTGFGLIVGFASGFAILNAYYKLTDKLKFMEYEDYKKAEGRG